MRLQRGFFVLGTVRGIKLRAHWSTPLACIVAGGVAMRPVVWAVALCLVAVHELGHALLAKNAGARVMAIDLAGWGGLCQWRGEVSALQRAWIAAGGVAAQLMVAAIAAVAFAIKPATAPWTSELAYGLLQGNLTLAAINLIPLAPLDGVEAWKVFSLTPPAVKRAWHARTRQRTAVKQAHDVIARATRDVNARD